MPTKLRLSKQGNSKNMWIPPREMKWSSAEIWAIHKSCSGVGGSNCWLTPAWCPQGQMAAAKAWGTNQSVQGTCVLAGSSFMFIPHPNITSKRSALPCDQWSANTCIIIYLATKRKHPADCEQKQLPRPGIVTAWTFGLRLVCITCNTSFHLRRGSE